MNIKTLIFTLVVLWASVLVVGLELFSCAWEDFSDTCVHCTDDCLDPINE